MMLLFCCIYFDPQHLGFKKSVKGPSRNKSWPKASYRTNNQIKFWMWDCLRLRNKEIRKSHLSQFLLYSSKLRMDVINQPLTCCSLFLEETNLASNLISVKKNPVSKIQSLRYMWWGHILFAVVTKWSIFLMGWLDSNIVLEGQKRLVSTVCFKALGFWGFFTPKKGVSILESVACEL